MPTLQDLRLQNLNLQDPSLLRQQAFINNQWINASETSNNTNTNNNDTSDVINPFNGQVIGTIPNLSKEQITQAVAFAHQAQTKWAKKTAKERSHILSKWADLIDQHKEDLATIMTSEQGKPISESRGEIDYANSFIRWFAEEGKRVYGDVIPATDKNLRYIILKQPIGVCAAITPWNFPAAMITRKVAPALAAGCTMLVKPATETPLTALALAELALRAGLPEGVLQIITGKSSIVGKVFTQDDRIQKLSFTGSTEVGRTLMSQCASTVKKLSMELGGNAPFIVFEDANLDHAVTGLIASKYRNAGQTCVCANRIYVHSSIKNQFLSLFKQKVDALNVGNGMNSNVEIGPLINQDALNKVQKLLKDATDKGATLVTGGQKHHASDLSFEPTIITDISDDMDIAHEEIFGPIAPVFIFDDEEQVMNHANKTIYGLAAYFYTQDLKRSWRVTEGLEYGMVAQNTGVLSTEVAPFGGIKQSGFGREGSKYGIEEYITTKYWCVDIS